MNDKVRSFILFLEKDKIFVNFFVNRFFSKNNVNLLKKKRNYFLKLKVWMELMSANRVFLGLLENNFSRKTIKSGNIFLS